MASCLLICKAVWSSGPDWPSCHMACDFSLWSFKQCRNACSSHRQHTHAHAPASPQLQEIKELAAKLFVRGQKLGNDIFSLEARRWSPDAAARKGVPTAAGADPTLLALVQAAGLLGDEQTMAERTTEYVCSGEGCRRLK